MTPQPPTHPRAVITEFVRLWSLGDLTTAFTLVHEDAEYTLHLSGEQLPVGGVVVGRAHIEAGLRQAREVFDYLVYRPIRIAEVQNEVRVPVEFMYRHRPSGEIISGHLRLMFQVQAGLITRAEEFHDRAMVETFLKLYASPAEPMLAAE